MKIMNKFENYLASIIFIVIGLLSILGFEVPSKVSGGIKPSLEYGTTSILIGFIFLCIGYRSKEKEKKYSKCPKCKETFTYAELEKGKCRYCKDTDTVDIDKYFKIYPDELNDK